MSASVPRPDPEGTRLHPAWEEDTKSNHSSCSHTSDEKLEDRQSPVAAAKDHLQRQDQKQEREQDTAAKDRSRSILFNIVDDHENEGSSPQMLRLRTNRPNVNAPEEEPPPNVTTTLVGVGDPRTYARQQQQQRPRPQDDYSKRSSKGTMTVREEAQQKHVSKQRGEEAKGTIQVRHFSEPQTQATFLRQPAGRTRWKSARKSRPASTETYHARMVQNRDDADSDNMVGAFAAHVRVGGNATDHDVERGRVTTEQTCHNAEPDQDIVVSASLSYMNMHPTQAPVIADEGGGPTDANLVEAELVVDASPKTRRLLFFGVVGVILILLITIVLSFYFVSQRNGENDSFAAPEGKPRLPFPPTLEQVTKSGLLRCGVSLAIKDILDTYGEHFEIGPFIDVALCRAIAAAVLNDGDKVRIVTDFEKGPLHALANNELDLIIGPEMTSLARDVHNDNTGMGYTLSTPLAYVEMALYGVSEHVDCADRLDGRGECSGTKLCFLQGGELMFLPGASVLYLESADDILPALWTGDCNVLLLPKLPVAYEKLWPFGFSDNLKLSNKTIAHVSFAITTRDGDAQWSDLVDSVSQALLAAEQTNITQLNAKDFPQTDLFGPDYTYMYANAIAAVGNYAEVYNRSLEPVLPRSQSWNRINNGTSGLHGRHTGFSLLLFGNTAGGPGPVAGGTLELILKRDILSCGVRGGRPGFATFDNATKEWRGIDIDFCRALAAGLFGGDRERVRFGEFLDPADGFGRLARKEVDVVAGGTWTLQNDVREPSTGVGYSFSPPYLYASPYNTFLQTNTSSMEDNFCLVTRQDDQQWSSFVYWIVANSFEAEFLHVTPRNATYILPTIQLFGNNFTRMLIDSTLALGNYGGIYNRNLAPLWSRDGRNLLLQKNDNTPRLYLRPGFFH